MTRTIETAPGCTEASSEEMASLRAIANKPPVEGRDYQLMPGENSPESTTNHQDQQESQESADSEAGENSPKLADDDRVEPVNHAAEIMLQVSTDILAASRAQGDKFQFIAYMTDNEGKMACCCMATKRFQIAVADALCGQLMHEAEQHSRIVTETNEIKKYLNLKGN